MDWRTWTLFAITESLLCLTPGPAVLMVLSRGLARGTAASTYSALGILAGNLAYFILSATSLGALLIASFNLFLMIKWIGAAYLIWLGLGTFFGRASGLGLTAAPRKPATRSRFFTDGFVLQASNPKALIFFSAILPQFIDPHRPIAPQVAILALTSLVIEFFVLLAYGAFAGRISEFATAPRFARTVERLAGSMLIAAGVGIASIHRDS